MSRLVTTIVAAFLLGSPLLVTPALAGPVACQFDEQCPAGSTCVEGRCWALSGGVPAECVGIVLGSPQGGCMRPSEWMEDADFMCSAAGGTLNEQVYGDACGGELYKSSMSLCCVAGGNIDDPNVIQGTNVEQLRARLRQQVLDDLGCRGATDNGALPLATLALVVLVAIRRVR